MQADDDTIERRGLRTRANPHMCCVREVWCGVVRALGGCLRGGRLGGGGGGVTWVGRVGGVDRGSKNRDVSWNDWAQQWHVVWERARNWTPLAAEWTLAMDSSHFLAADPIWVTLTEVTAWVSGQFKWFSATRIWERWKGSRKGMPTFKGCFVLTDTVLWDFCTQATPFVSLLHP